MTDYRIEELAAEVAKEVSSRLDGFAIKRVERKSTTLLVTFGWRLPFHFEVSIPLHTHDTDDAVRNEIRRQLQAALPGLSDS